MTRTRRGDHRKYGSVRILPDGRVRFSPWTFPGLPQLNFTVVYTNDSDVAAGNYTIWAEWGTDPLFLLYVSRHRVDTNCFALTLSADGLRHAVAVMRAAGNGLERWIIPGLEWCQREFVKLKNPEPNRQAMAAIVPELMKSVRHLPVAAPWKERVRYLDRRDREIAAAQSKDARPAENAPPAGQSRSRATPARRARTARSRRR